MPARAVLSLTSRKALVTPTLANHALALLARLFRYGTISYHGAFVGLSSLAGVHVLRIDPKYWRRLRNRYTAKQVVFTQGGSPASTQAR